LTIADQAAIRFDGAATDFSLCAMITTDAIAQTQALFSKLDGGNDGYELFIQSNGTVMGSVNATDATTTVTLPDSSVHSVMMVVYRSGAATDTIKIYIDGWLAKSHAVSQTLATTADLQVGNRNPPTRGVNGSMLSAFVMNFALTPLQVNDLHRTMLREINKE